MLLKTCCQVWSNDIALDICTQIASQRIGKGKNLKLNFIGVLGHAHGVVSTSIWLI